MVAPSGDQFEISGGGYRAVVTESGAGLRLLEHDGRPLVLGFAEDEQSTSGAGSCSCRGPTGSATGATPSRAATCSCALTEAVPRQRQRTGWCAGPRGPWRS